MCHCNMLRVCPPPRADRRGTRSEHRRQPGRWCAENRRMGAFLSCHLLADLAAVKAFAGEDYHVAVTYPDDEAFELLSDPYVFQHEVEVVSPL